MNATLEAQIQIAQPLLSEAAHQNNLELAKFALGMLAGALTAAVPEEDRYAIFSSAIEISHERSVDTVLDCAAWLLRRAADLY